MRAARALILLLSCGALLSADEPPARPDPAIPAKLTEEQQKRLKEADAYIAEANKKLVAGKLRESVTEIEKAITIRREVYGPDHEKVVQLWRTLGNVLRDRAQWGAAKKAFEQVLAIQERRFGKDHWQTTDARWSLVHLERVSKLDQEQRRKFSEAERLQYEAASLYRSARYADALSSINKARDLYLATVGEHHRSFADSCTRLARLYRSTGEPKKALPLCLQARDLRKELLGDRHPDYATSLKDIADVYAETGDQAKALPLYLEIRELRKELQGERSAAYAFSLHDLAGVYGAMGDSTKALSLNVQALELMRAAVGEKHPEYATSLNNLAVRYEGMGEYTKALPLLLQARDLNKSLFGVKHPKYAAAVNNLAHLYYEMGDFAKALPLHLETRDIQKAAGHDHNTEYALTLNNLAHVYLALGDHANGMPLLFEARDLQKALVGERHPYYIVSLNNLAQAYCGMIDYANALPLALKVRDLRKEVYGEHHRDYAVSLNNLAGVYLGMGEYDKALPLYLQARDITKAALGDHHRSYAGSLNNLAALYSAMGEYDKALPLYLESRDITKSIVGEHHIEYANRLNNLAAVYVGAKQPEKARPLYEEAIAIVRETIDHTADAQAERQQILTAQTLRNYLDAYLSFFVRNGLCNADTYRAVLDAKGTVLARSNSERLAREADPESARLANELRDTAGRLAAQSLTAPPPQQQNSWKKRLRSLESDRERLEQQLSGRSAAFRSEQARRHSTPEQVSDALPETTAVVDMLEYSHNTPPANGKGKEHFERRLLAFVLRRGKPPAVVELGAVAPIAEAITAWRRPMESSSLSPVDDEAARELHRLLWRPLAPHLDGIHTVLISPDGAVCSLPFAALPGEKPDSYLIEQFAIGYLPSARAVLDLADNTSRATAGLLGIGDVAYGERPRPASPGMRRAFFRPLPGTRLELEHVAANYRAAYPTESAAKLLTGSEPDAPALKRELTPANGHLSYRFIHLACHGFFDPVPMPPRPNQSRDDDLASTEPSSAGAQSWRATVRDPLLRSGLVLAGANQSAEKGTLTAAEVAGLDLGGCDLAVLSACQTGLGGVTNGEGVLGLQRAFHQAGARSLVASLWSVNDAGTSVLMDEFYANLWTKKLPKLEALRQAQLAVLQHPDRVAKRADELRTELARRGVPAELLASRGLESKEGEGADSLEAASRRSHPALWAAFVLSGEYR
jgi:CHAT domain-containing protein